MTITVSQPCVKFIDGDEYFAHIGFRVIALVADCDSPADLVFARVPYHRVAPHANDLQRHALIKDDTIEEWNVALQREEGTWESWSLLDCRHFRQMEATTVEQELDAEDLRCDVCDCNAQSDPGEYALRCEKCNLNVCCACHEIISTWHRHDGELEDDYGSSDSPGADDNDENARSAQSRAREQIKGRARAQVESRAHEQIMSLGDEVTFDRGCIQGNQEVCCVQGNQIAEVGITIDSTGEVTIEMEPPNPCADEFVPGNWWDEQMETHCQGSVRDRVPWCGC